MDKPIIATRYPFPLEVEKGQQYLWCACGRSANQPWCDGSHQGTGNEPVLWVAPRSKIAFFCGCKHSSLGPLCDGRHNKLPK